MNDNTRLRDPPRRGLRITPPTDDVRLQTANEKPHGVRSDMCEGGHSRGSADHDTSESLATLPSSVDQSSRTPTTPERQIPTLGSLVALDSTSSCPPSASPYTPVTWNGIYSYNDPDSPINLPSGSKSGGWGVLPAQPLSAKHMREPSIHDGDSRHTHLDVPNIQPQMTASSLSLSSTLPCIPSPSEGGGGTQRHPITQHLWKESSFTGDVNKVGADPNGSGYIGDGGDGSPAAHAADGEYGRGRSIPNTKDAPGDEKVVVRTSAFGQSIGGGDSEKLGPEDCGCCPRIVRVVLARLRSFIFGR